MAAPKKPSVQRPATYARGGKGAPNQMLPEAAAGPAKSGITGKAPTKAPGSLRARGGPPIRGYSLSMPAVGGHTAPVKLGKGR
jgi:hypothetical protein